MRFIPKNLVFPAVIICSLSLVTLSMAVNSGLAQPQTDNQTDFLSSRNASNAQLSSLFPESIQKWKTLIEHSASETGLDPNLIAAAILQESGGNSQAISSSGAVGLMQVMPNDGIASEFICGSQPCFGNRPSTNELLDPKFNIEFGSNYLSDLIQARTTEREALRIYGPMDVGYYYADIVLAILDSYR